MFPWQAHFFDGHQLPSLYFASSLIPCPVPTYHKADSAAFTCSRNIEMTPLCKIEVTLPRFLGSREVRRGGVDEQAGVQSPCGVAARPIRRFADHGRLRADWAAASAGISSVARPQAGRCHEPAFQASGQTQQPSAAGGGSYSGPVACARAVHGLWPDLGGREAGGAAWLHDLARDLARLDDRRWAVAGPTARSTPGSRIAARCARCWPSWTTRRAG